ncbi:activity-regulated cytoskeleton-associated protein [Rhizophagus irregularis DAOM 181602=DAOM 197198]|nr:activity-regulated cytoskeleton-associated protein [Rhizophagus irregularis DAOM 181602=DAOM 197198]
MPFYNLSKAELKSHQRKHRRGRVINQKEVYCIQCYPTDSIPADNIPDGFEKFWLWISIQYTAKQYTGATVAAFKVLKTEFFITTQLNTLVGITTKILQSIKFRQINTPLLELSFYLHKLFELTNGFKSLPTDTQITNAYQIFHNTPVNNNANMDQGQMRDLMKLVWGADPTDNNNPRNVGNLLENTLNNNTNAITTALQNNLTAINALTTANQNRTTSKVVDVPFFYGRDDEDPYEWCRLFEAAFDANGWPDNRKIALAAGFLKEAARDWYEEDRGNINQWHIDANANNFDTRFINYFATAAQRNQWTRELQNIKQGDNESVENYSRRFKKLLNKATQGEALAARYQINYYINGLKSFLHQEII